MNKILAKIAIWCSFIFAAILGYLAYETMRMIVAVAGMLYIVVALLYVNQLVLMEVRERE